MDKTRNNLLWLHRCTVLYQTTSAKCLLCSVFFPTDQLGLWCTLKVNVHFGAQNLTKYLALILFFYILSDFDCNDPLGMESGEIPSDQIIASTQYNPSWSPERSRLNYYENAWTPAEDSNKEWIQVAISFLLFLLTAA